MSCIPFSRFPVQRHRTQQAKTTLVPHASFDESPANKNTLSTAAAATTTSTAAPLKKMGIPYSRQINAAFEQVTPLVAAGFKVLRTTRDISILLAVIQVLTVILLGFILVALIVLLYCVNPDLEVRSPLMLSSCQKGSLNGACC
jgi:hypothetical protein